MTETSPRRDPAPTETCRVGIVAERRRGSGPWSNWLWRPIAAIAGGATMSPGTMLREDDGLRHVYIGDADVTFVVAETGGYLANLESAAASLFVIAMPLEDENLGLRLRGVTASAWEAEAYLDGMHVVERVAMPESVLELALDFVAAHHVEKVFLKRQRKRHDPNKGFGRGSGTNDYGPGTFEPTR